MTHYRARRDAFLTNSGCSDASVLRRACGGCGREFNATRIWQKHCSPRCRQRLYVQRQLDLPPGYYGA